MLNRSFVTGGRRLASLLLILFLIADIRPAVGQEQSGGPFDLDLCIELALKNNPTMIQSRNELVSADAEVRAARGNWLPRVSMNGNSSRSGGDQYFATLRVPSNQISAGGGLTFSQTFFRGGYNFAQYKASKRDREMADYGLEISERSLILQTKQAYFDLLRNQGLLKEAEENETLSRQQLDRARSLVIVGMSPPSDTLTAKLQLSQNRSLLIGRRNGLALAKADLCYIMGIEIDTPIEVVDILDRIEKLPDPQESIDEAYLNRPDLKRAEASIERSRASVSLARSSRFPTLTGSARYSGGMSESLTATGGQQPGSGGSTRRYTNWSFSLGFNVSLYDGYSTGSNIQRAIVALDNAQAQLQDQERSVSLSVRRAHLSLKEALESMEVAEEQVTLASENLKLAAERYRVGKGTSLEYQVAQVSHLQARNGLVDALYNIHLAQAALDDAIYGSGRSVGIVSGARTSTAVSVTPVGTMGTPRTTTGTGGMGGATAQPGSGGRRQF
jgi:TolC family type I secretion outer membrane protein